LTGVNSWKYKGQFKNDKISGKGRFRWNNQKEYIGEWDNNELSGYGILINKNDRYVGYFTHNNKHGYGATFYNGQSALLGKWKNDNIEGNAILITFIDLEKSNNYNIDDDENIENNFQFIKTQKGEIIRNNLDNEELTKFKSSKEYSNMVLLYKKNFILITSKVLKNSIMIKPRIIINHLIIVPTVTIPQNFYRRITTPVMLLFFPSTWIWRIKNVIRNSSIIK